MVNKIHAPNVTTILKQWTQTSYIGHRKSVPQLMSRGQEAEVILSMYIIRTPRYIDPMALKSRNETSGPIVFILLGLRSLHFPLFCPHVIC